MNDATQNVSIERVNWVRREGGELVVSLVTMGRPLAFSFKADAAQALLEGIVAALREQVDEAIPVSSATSAEFIGPTVA
ncbi:hypothetical protein JHFBIEKO_3099 [Methylobacterium mesophilicum]|uniref:hypothetical protein n=1 Tax=Methylobacterium mesophilicum TaxID=39956 RepID=UPI001EE33D13|nr:hypothetical protein [Methylobacterium mesophilicum]GJE22643.1 hypothetical protein JHFBIEKO_3099 [Methylobacterium mesophilicum]